MMKIWKEKSKVGIQSKRFRVIIKLDLLKTLKPVSRIKRIRILLANLNRFLLNMRYFGKSCNKQYQILQDLLLVPLKQVD